MPKNQSHKFSKSESRPKTASDLCWFRDAANLKLRLQSPDPINIQRFYRIRNTKKWNKIIPLRSVPQTAGYKERGFILTASNYCWFSLFTPGRTDLLIHQLCEHLQKDFDGLDKNMWSSRSIMLSNDLRNTVETRAANFAKTVIKNQGKHLPRNTSTFLQASVTNKSSDDITVLFNCITLHLLSNVNQDSSTGSMNQNAS